MFCFSGPAQSCLISLLCSKYFVKDCKQKQPRGALSEKVFSAISQNSQENTCARSLFFSKVAGLRAATLLRKRLWHRCFPVNFVKFLRTPFLQNTSGGQFLWSSDRLRLCKVSVNLFKLYQSLLFMQIVNWIIVPFFLCIAIILQAIGQPSSRQ